MSTTYRVDRGSLRPPRRSADGLLRVDAHITRVGVFEYMNPDGTMRREYRPPEEVFAPEAISSFEQIVVTDDHPDEEITKKNAKRYMAGASGERVVRDDDHVRATLLIADETLIEKMESKKKRDVSCGYRCEIDPTPGIAPDGTRYDVIQRKIRGNHIAIVEAGRAGPTARVRMDAIGVRVYDQKPQSKEGGFMPPKKIDTVEELKKHLEATTSKLVVAEQRADAAEAQLSDAETRADRAEARATSLEERIAKLESTRIDESDVQRRDSDIAALKLQLSKAEQARKDAESPERLRNAVKRRVRIENAAAIVFGPTYVTDSMDDRELQIAICERIGGPVDSTRSDEYIESRFDTLVEHHLLTRDRMTEVGHSIRPNHEESAPRVDAKTARQKMIERNQQAGMQPLHSNAHKGA